MPKKKKRGNKNKKKQIPRYIFNKVVGLGMARMSPKAIACKLAKKYPDIKIPIQSIHSGIMVAKKIRAQNKANTRK